MRREERRSVGLEGPEGPRADLHIHSTASDGRLDPAAVIEAARAAGLVAVALTDHDTMDGLEEAGRAAQAAGLEFAPGIELSAHDDAGSTHLLGYFMNPGDRALNQHIDRALEHRRSRAHEIVRRLNDLGVGITADEIFAEASARGLVARSHIARALLAGGWVRSYQQAFDQFIAVGRPAYVPTQRLSPTDAIALIHGANGLAVLAHPGNRYEAETIQELADAGLDGLETHHPDHDPRTVRRLQALVDRLDLLQTGGSDWHGPRDGGPDRPGHVSVPFEWYERLHGASKARRGRSVSQGSEHSLGTGNGDG